MPLVSRIPQVEGAHGYVVTEEGFPLLAAGEKKTFEQTFSIDRLAGPGGATQSLFGGKRIPHIWTGKLSVDAQWHVR